MEITYSKHGDYLLPDLLVPERENCYLGRYGQLWLDYLKLQRRVLYVSLKTTYKLNEHLANIDRQAREMLEFLTSQMTQAESVMLEP